jgi:hypothetical protein
MGRFAQVVIGLGLTVGVFLGLWTSGHDVGYDCKRRDVSVFYTFESDCKYRHVGPTTAGWVWAVAGGGLIGADVGLHLALVGVATRAGVRKLRASRRRRATANAES